MTDKVLYEKKGEVVYVTLNRPRVKNAIDLEMHMRLREIWTDFRDDPKLRVAILTGAGDAFCAGADLKTHVPEWADVGPSLARDKLPDGFAGGITRGLHRLYKPIIAACNGWVLGGGLELAMACDIRIASERAQFGSFELRRGMHPADGGIVRLVNTCGVGIALEMELTGEPIDASAHAYTLTFPAGDLPPVNAFWSVTMYDGKTQLLIQNPIDRYLINSPMLPGLKKNADGSLTIYIQHASPGPDKESNWLPAPDGPVYLVMRLYWPKKNPPSILPAGKGDWKPPAVVKVS